MLTRYRQALVFRSEAASQSPWYLGKNSSDEQGDLTFKVTLLLYGCLWGFAKGFMQGYVCMIIVAGIDWLF